MFARKPDWTVLDEVNSCSGRPLDLASSLTKLIRHKIRPAFAAVYSF